MGTRSLPFRDALEPKVTEPPSGTDPLEEALARETAAPDWAQVAFQAW